VISLTCLIYKITNFTGQLVSDKTIDYSYNYDKNILESNITTAKNVMDLNQLIFYDHYDQIIGINMLPDSLKALTFSYDYNQTINVNVLPNNSLQTLTFGSEYNQTIGVNVLPNSLQTLTFGDDYDQTIGVNVLPNSLQTLTFGWKYNQTINVNVLPTSLKIIYFNFYNCSVHCDRYIVPHAFKNIVKYINVKS
jgi:hypothetical protein